MATVAIGLGVAVAAVVAVVFVHDVTQRRHSVLRNFPVVGHLRFMLEAVGPELRQYIVTDNDEERPFSRDERRWVYTSAKGANTLFGFGTDNDVDRAGGYVIVRHSARPHEPASGAANAPDPTRPLPCRKVLGAANGRREAFRPDSVVNISAMSWGALSGAAIEALNRGAAQAGCLHNTGEGGISPHHRHGGDLVLQIGTGYFGCRDDRGAFSMGRLAETVASAPVRAIEIKLSQGAKPGLGGMLPGAKVTREVAEVRGVPVGIDCKSPPRHHAFDGVDGLIDFVESIADETGLPVGVKSAVGEAAFWEELADRMAARRCGPDFVTVDGGEGGTGAAPLAFADHVALPFTWGFAEVFTAFARRGIDDRVVWVGSGKLGLPDRALLALALGCDLVNVAREAMLSIGCIQAQRCHTGHCPTGVATQSRWRQRGLDPTDKAVRCASYLASLRFELERLGRACGVEHPAQVPLDSFAWLENDRPPRSARDVFGYGPGWALPPAPDGP